MGIAYEISYYLELLAFLSVLILFRKHRFKELGVLLMILFLVVIGEGVNRFNAFPLHKLTINNLLVAIQFLGYLSLIHLRLISKRKKRIILALIIWVAIVRISDSIWGNSIQTTFQSYSYILGALAMITGIFIYFFEELKSFDHSIKVYQRFLFWVLGGLFIFLASEIPIMWMMHYMIENKVPISEFPIIKLKFYTSDLLYLFYILGALWMRKL